MSRKSTNSTTKRRGLSVLAPALALVAWLLASCQSMEGEFSDNPPPPSLPAPAEPQSKPASGAWSPIRPGDQLELFVEQDSTFDGTYRVREQGDIHLRSVGRIPVAGMTVSQAESVVRSKLEATQLKKATVTLDRISRAPEEAEGGSGPASAGIIRVYMTGHVSRPGQHRLPLPQGGVLGVYEAVLIAGGFGSFPDLAKVHLLRRDAEGKRHRIPVDVQKVQTGEIPDPPIGDGDVVVVPEKVFGF